MTVDYMTYELDIRQKAGFLALGYVVIFSVIFLFFRIPLVSGLAGFSIYLLLPAYADHLAEIRRKDLNSQFSDLLIVLSASIEAGRQMEEAIIEAEGTMKKMHDLDSPINRELGLMKKSLQENNGTDVELLTDFADRSGCDDIRNFVQVYLTCRNTGGDVGRIISHTSKIMHDKMEINRQISVLTAQKKLEGRIISIMPLAMMLALNLMSPSYVEPLYTTTAGRIVMLICLTGMCAGIWMMEKLTDVRM